MPTFNHIQHENKLVERKVNFFADYFQYAASSMFNADLIDVDNYLSLTDKILYQVEKNFENCPQYIDKYLTHPLFDLKQNEKYLVNYKALKPLIFFIARYKTAGNKNKKKQWIADNPNFNKTLLQFRRGLTQSMFNNSLKAIISYLKCDHEIHHHHIELKHHIHIIISELLLQNRSEKDVKKIIDKIMSESIGDFPSPPDIAQIKDKENKNLEKNKFLSARSFDQQLNGISNFFRERMKKENLIYRVYGVKTPDNFSFKYNRVTFYNPNHPKFQTLVQLVQREKFLEGFLDADSILLASLKVSFHSPTIAQDEAVNTINNELRLVNRICGSNGYLEKYAFLSTNNFKVFGISRSSTEKRYIVRDLDLERLNNNPFRGLSNVNKDLKIHFLNCESLYIQAWSLRNFIYYWNYLEALLLPCFNNRKKNYIEAISNILLLDVEDYEKYILREYIYTAFLPYHMSPQNIGVTRERKSEIEKEMRTNINFNYSELLKEINHPFVRYLLKQYIKPFSKAKFFEIKKYYQRQLFSLKDQRNSLIHAGASYEKSVISLYASIPNLIARFHGLLIEKIKQSKEDNFEALIQSLYEEGQKLIKR